MYLCSECQNDLIRSKGQKKAALFQEPLFFVIFFVKLAKLSAITLSAPLEKTH